MDTLERLFTQKDSDGELSFVYPIYPNEKTILSLRNKLLKTGINLELVSQNIWTTDVYDLLTLGNWLAESMGGYKKTRLLTLMQVAKGDRRLWVPVLTKSLLSLAVLELNIEQDEKKSRRECHMINAIMLETHLFQYRLETHQKYGGNKARLENLIAKYESFMPFIQGSYPIIPQPGINLPEFWHVLTEIRV